MWKKTSAVFVFFLNIYYIENLLQYCTSADSYQHVGTHLQKVATFSCSLATTGRELQPPDFHTSFYWQDTSNFIQKASTLRFTRFLQFLHQTSVMSSSIIFVYHGRDSSFLDHIHRCIVDSDLSIKNRVRPCRYSLEKFIHSPPLRMHTLYNNRLLLI